MTKLKMGREVSGCRFAMLGLAAKRDAAIDLTAMKTSRSNVAQIVWEGRETAMRRCA
jgi:hypothetical protein